MIVANDYSRCTRPRRVGPTLRISDLPVGLAGSAVRPWPCSGSFTVGQAAGELGVSRETIYRRIRNQRLVGVKFGHVWRIHIPESLLAPCVA
jgi:excisionase family DNA binding protein